jgi:hypothetical protein
MAPTDILEETFASSASSTPTEIPDQTPSPVSKTSDVLPEKTQFSSSMAPTMSLDESSTSVPITPATIPDKTPPTVETPAGIKEELAVIEWDDPHEFVRSLQDMIKRWSLSMSTSKYPVRNRNPEAEDRKELLAQGIEMQKLLYKYGFIKEQDIGRPVMLRKTTEKDEDGNFVWSNVDSWKKLKNLGPFGLHDYQRVMAIFEGYNTDVEIWRRCSLGRHRYA